ncbi:MAG: helix-turn-helix transcriptional regulator [Pseudomonadales bacterium]|nr:helix-turn-helix transcriptional regulator [Pseudomonadales bacterium]
MNEQRQRSSLFNALKQILKVQGVRYRDLAELLNTSEPTIKRLFQDQDCKLSRLIEICQMLGISFEDLLEVAANNPVQSKAIPLEIEQALASRPGLMAFFVLLVSDIDQTTIAEQNNLDATDVYLYLRELEKLGLIRLDPKDIVHFLVDRPIKWRLDGPLHSMLVRVNQQFVADTLSEHKVIGYPFYSTSRLFSTHSIKQLNDEVDRLYQRFQHQAALDQMFYPSEQLLPYKMISTIAPFELARYFEVPAFSQDS